MRFFRRTAEETSLVQVNLVLFIRPMRTLWRMTTIKLSALVTDLRVGFASVREAPFCSHSHIQIPQSDLCTIPATCLLKDSSQVNLDCLFRCLDPRCDFCVCLSLENKCRDRPLFARKIHVSRQQRHDFTPTPNSNAANCIPAGFALRVPRCQLIGTQSGLSKLDSLRASRSLSSSSIR